MPIISTKYNPAETDPHRMTALQRMASAYLRKSPHGLPEGVSLEIHDVEIDPQTVLQCYFFKPEGLRDENTKTVFWIPATASASLHDKYIQDYSAHIAKSLGYQVITINHRLGRSNKFTRPLDDVVNVIREYLISELHGGLRLGDVSLGGYSSGGFLASLIAINNFRYQFPIHQLLLVMPLVSLNDNPERIYDAEKHFMGEHTIQDIIMNFVPTDMSRNDNVFNLIKCIEEKGPSFRPTIFQHFPKNVTMVIGENEFMMPDYINFIDAIRIIETNLNVIEIPDATHKHAWVNLEYLNDVKYHFENAIPSGPLEFSESIDSPGIMYGTETFLFEGTSYGLAKRADNSDHHSGVDLMTLAHTSPLFHSPFRLKRADVELNHSTSSDDFDDLIIGGHECNEGSYVIFGGLHNSSDGVDDLLIGNHKMKEPSYVTFGGMQSSTDGNAALIIGSHEMNEPPNVIFGLDASHVFQNKISINDIVYTQQQPTTIHTTIQLLNPPVIQLNPREIPEAETELMDEMNEEDEVITQCNLWDTLYKLASAAIVLLSLHYRPEAVRFAVLHTLPDHLVKINPVPDHPTKICPAPDHHIFSLSDSAPLPSWDDFEDPSKNSNTIDIFNNAVYIRNNTAYIRDVPADYGIKIIDTADLPAEHNSQNQDLLQRQTHLRG